MSARYVRYQPALDSTFQHPLIRLKWQRFRHASGTCPVKMSAWTPTAVTDVNFSPRMWCDVPTWYGSSRLWTPHDSFANTDGKCPWIKFLLNFNRVFRHNYAPVKISSSDMSVSMSINTSLLLKYGYEKRYRQRTYNVTLKPVRAITVTVGKQ
jgi:hypothetical protein